MRRRWLTQSVEQQDCVWSQRSCEYVLLCAAVFTHTPVLFSDPLHHNQRWNDAGESRAARTAPVCLVGSTHDPAAATAATAQRSQPDGRQYGAAEAPRVRDRVVAPADLPHVETRNAAVC